MTRVLFVSAEPVGEAMAGPAIRVVELARAVAEHCEVAVAAPGPSDPAAVPGELIEAGLSDFDVLLEAVRRHDVVVAQRLPPQLLRYVARMPVRFVADLYNPQMIEVLEAMDGGGESSQRRAWRSMLGQCAVADLVLCASEKQRDMWLGGLGLAGLIDPERYRADPTFRSFVDVVPFGLPDRPPRPSPEPVLRGVWPGIGPDDRVLIWAGGVWRWLDAITPIRAVERLRAGGRHVHLVFLGTGRPASDPGDVPTSADAAIAFARERGLDGKSVHFNRGWVPYGQREAYLTEADVGVCAHHDHLEARFSYRTRVLDHFWAGLPSVVSGGDSIGDLVERHGLGRVVSPGDDEGFAAALAELLDDPGAYGAAAQRVRELTPSLRWSECARPLVRFCLEHERRPRRRPPRGALARATYGQYPDVLAALREHGGLREAARGLPRHVARILRHRA
ncbi:MAG TPA: glycosyltransferase [Thermoleophilaceae bacterium]|nr:glycosyltransferase [Thermoleophilaceae bacterium]